ncbi:MAG: hypothetical protein V4689_22830 [Verrucomicrobiota bacterium]
MKFPAFKVLAWAVFTPGIASALPRIWTASDGREMVAEFITADTTSVTVKRDNGKSAIIPLSMLNEEDRKYAEEQRAKLLAEKEAAEKSAAEAAKKPQGSITYKLSGGSEKWH